MKEFAVVFDGAGTLIRKFRVAKDIQNGSLLHDVVSLNLVGTRPDYALVVFQLDVPKELEGVPANLFISDFIVQYQIGLDVVCANTNITTADAVQAVNTDKKATVRDLHDVIHGVSKHCRHTHFTGIAMVVDINTKRIPYVLATCGDLFKGTQKVIDELEHMGAKIYIASGDAKNTLYSLARCIAIPLEQVKDMATPTVKEQLVQDLQQRYELVIMVGDGINDIPALRAADVGILTVQQKEKRPKMLYDAADMVIQNIEQLPDILRKIIMDKRYTNNGSQEATF